MPAIEYHHARSSQIITIVFDESSNTIVKIKPQSEVIASGEVVRGQCPPYIFTKRSSIIMQSIESTRSSVSNRVMEKAKVVVLYRFKVIDNDHYMANEISIEERD
jgi:hypothetical protein